MPQRPRLKYLNLTGEVAGKIEAKAVKMGADRRLTEEGGCTKIWREKSGCKAALGV
jgi:hypothetical protein